VLLFAEGVTRLQHKGLSNAQGSAMYVGTAPAPVDRPSEGAKFNDPLRTAKGEPRAQVALRTLRTLWFNTGTLCNIACPSCYIESSPTNDRLAYLTAADVRPFLDEIASNGLPVREIGFTGGEPLMNRHLPEILADVLNRGFEALVLTNAMQPLWQKRDAMKALHAQFGKQLKLRVSIDHHSQVGHERLRGPDSWAPLMRGLEWLAAEGFCVDVAGRTIFGETDAAARLGYQALFDRVGLALDARDPARLVLFPEMDETADTPEITTACWDILGVRPDAMMCASSRMVVKRRGALRPAVVACTLVPYDQRFELGASLAEASGPVALNHPHCSRFCVLGGGTCIAP